jgi:hypothetical protein
MIRLKILNSYYKIIDGYTINESSREVKFSNIKIDFTNKTILDLPRKYQEVQVVDIDQNNNIEIIFTGYINNFVLPKMKNKNEYRELEIELLTPLAMATIRTADAVGTYDLKTLIREIIRPLISDGFVLKSLYVGENQITVNFLNETIESSLNKLSNKYNLWWYIDENKNFYVNEINYLMSLNPKMIYDDDNKINGLIDLVPSIDATDYCNVVNFTNVRLYVESYYDSEESEGYYPLFSPRTIKNGDEIVFNQPFDISEKAAYMMGEDNYFRTKNVFYLFGKKNNSNTESLLIDLRYLEGNFMYDDNVTFSDSYSEESEWVLVRDSFFKNLIVGLKYNGNDSIEITSASSYTSLVWANVKIQNQAEINKSKNIVSATGIVERKIDMNEQWKTYKELIKIADSYIKTDPSKVDTVKIKVDEKIDLSIGDTIKIDKEDFLINDLYIVTDKTSVLDGNYTTWEYTLKNTNILDNYVDLFRAKEQETNEKTINLVTSDYIEEEIIEKYEVSINES